MNIAITLPASRPPHMPLVVTLKMASLGVFNFGLGWFVADILCVPP